MNEEIFDVILQSTGRFHADVYTYQEHRPPENDFFLGPELWVGHLPKGIEPDLVFDACGPAGLNFRPARQYGMRYAFCRRVRPDRSNYYKWDSDISLAIALFLSRLIRTTTIATSLAARLYFSNDELKSIVPGPTQGLAAHAWVIAKDDWRDWLSVPELEQLRNLLPLYQTHAPDRVRRARKHIDHAFHAYYLDQRFASLVTSFESLLKTSKDNVTAQFKSRTSRLAEILGYQLSAEDLKAMYSDRSDFVHGSPASFSELSEELRERYNRFEQVIRLALLRASTEPAFAQHFTSPEAVEKAFGS
jgi:hypothetical protein